MYPLVSILSQSIKGFIVVVSSSLPKGELSLALNTATSIPRLDHNLEVKAALSSGVIVSLIANISAISP